MAGLPGTGLGGIFYVLLLIYIIIREVWLTSSRRSSAKRWGDIARLGCLAGGILASLWFTGALLQSLLATSPDLATHLAISALVPALAISPFVVLLLVIVGVQFLAFFVKPERVVQPAPERPADETALGSDTSSVRNFVG